MHKSIAALPLIALAWSSAAEAGTEPLYLPAPEWVQPVDMDEVVSDSGPAELLRDWQYRIEDGVVHAYTDHAVRIDNPQALMAQNTQNISWLPDKGDLTIHAFQIYRDDEVIDLIADGVTFEVLRREQGLENRLIDGQLTATVSVPGLREDDVLRIAYSVSTDDQALGDEVQATQFLPSAPWQVGVSRATISWPAEEEMFWRAEERVGLGEPVERNGYRYLSVDLPLAEPDPIPNDAPFRFRRPPVLRVGSFASWEELSAVMTPHFESAASIAEGSEVAQQAAAIMQASDEPLARAAMAVRLVQEEVSYLLNGLDGGNYLPQSAEETWEIRYGDCKAKSVLLLSLLREMGIESEVVLVSSRGGDAVPELLPLPAAFDHMIVHAVIDGTDYWLDGTSSATRLATIGDVPPFYYALPLRAGGTGLVPMEQRDLAVPRMTMDIGIDHSAGVDFPSLFTMTMQLVGPAGSQMQSLVDQDNPEILRQMAEQFASNDDMQVSHLSISYDEEEAIATLVVEGIAPSDFTWEDGRLRSALDDPSDINFNPDRARPSWRDIPVATTGPMRMATSMTMILPQDGAGFSLDGDPQIEGGFGNTRISGSTAIDGNLLHGQTEIFSALGEIPASELSDAKRAARRLQGHSLELVPPETITWRWQLTEDERLDRAQPILAAYADAIDFADEANFTPRMYRAWFLTRIYEFEAALADFDHLAEESPSVWVLNQRARLNQIAGNMDAAEADLQAAFDLEPNNAQAQALADLWLALGRADEALELLESMPVGDSDRAGHTDSLAHALAASGDVAAGQALIDELLAVMPNNPTALNTDCWYRGIYRSALDSAMERCTQAVERTSDPANAIDSRALIHFREGRFAEALVDLDAALDLEPEQAASYYLRGIVRLHSGDAGGQEDIDTALLMAPLLEARYARYDIMPPQ